jgi:hypothetical protein
MIFRYLKPLMLVLVFAGLTISAVEVTLAMWETNKSTVFAVCIIFTSFWVGLLFDYLDERALYKLNKTR